MATPDEIDALEVSLVDWVGATKASTLLELAGYPTRWWVPSCPAVA